MKTAYFVIFITLTLIPHLAAADATLQWLPEHLRPNPFGEIVEADRGAGEKARSGPIELTGARDGYVSCHLLVSAKQYGISIEAASLEPEMFREWFHYLPESETWYPDALIPVSLPHKSVLPEPDNKIADQRIQAYWLDIWIPKDAKPGLHEGQVLLTTTAGQSVLPLRIRVLPATVPSQDVVTPDHNSYRDIMAAAPVPALCGRCIPAHPRAPSHLL
jgi:hypothetical protein